MLSLESKINKSLLLILAFVDFIWIRSSLGKLTEDKFADSLGATLIIFASKNPYSFFKQFLQDTAIPNSKIFGLLTMYGELFVAISLGLSIIYLLISKPNKFILLIFSLGLISGMGLNGIFWLASGWLSPSADGLNLLMFFIQLVGLLVAINTIKSIKQ